MKKFLRDVPRRKFIDRKGHAMTEPNQDNSISVDIYDQTYHLRGQDTDYIRHLADIVDVKMRAVASHGKTVDSLRVAVLASLNIADELVTLEKKYMALTGQASQTQSSLRTRAHSLAGLLDSVLDEGRKIG
ncbi:MAG TPA: cell division protein ZapA [Acidobacteriaceae bacterium]|nr:cell division protein ZapA [Acidobacteriaceae bacterium]